MRNRSVGQRLATTIFLLCLAVLGGSVAPRVVAQTGGGDGGWSPDGFAVGFSPVADGFERPVFLADPNDGTGRLFVVEQPGRIRILQDGDVLAEPFLDISATIEAGGERGLLSMAFDPDYAETGQFFVGYTGEDSTNVVARFTVDPADPNRADPESQQVLISVDDPFPNHNGGLVMFGPDGYLYVGMGDGGSGGDPQGNGQNLATLLGKILRIDVRGDAGESAPFYRVPDDNPFVGQADAAPEIWAYGLRNPWRFSFDRESGDLFIADVGQGAFEEVNHQPADGPGGDNYGWNRLEGSSCYPAGDPCDPEGTVLPVAEYGHDVGSSVTGGYVYRGASAPDLAGVYLFADFASGNIWGLARDDAGEWAMSEPVDSGLAIASFAEDAQGELFVAAFDGTIYRVTGAGS